MSRLVVVLNLLLVIPAHADPPAPDGVPVQYELGRSILGVRIGVAPGVVMQRRAKPVAYTGYVRLELLRGLVVVKTEVTSQPGVDQPARWWFDLHLGGELQPLALAGRVLRPMKRLIRRAR